MVENCNSNNTRRGDVMSKNFKQSKFPTKVDFARNNLTLHDKNLTRMTLVDIISYYFNVKNCNHNTWGGTV